MRRLVTAVAAFAFILSNAVPASAATIHSGHVDGFDIDYVNGVLTLDIKTYAPVDDDVSPSGTTLALSAASATTVPSGAAWSCLGAAGSTVYVAPQSQNANLLYAGWNTQDVPAAQGPVALELVSATAPAGGWFALYTTGGFPAAPTFRLSGNPAAGCGVASWPGGIAAGTHAHGNWAFSAAGTYALTFRATAANGVTSGAVTYTFQVG
ncbi:hypothetical protein Val02_61350 [Virgisporangium aliadipatigenens]|uniref:Surface-anchored protein n=1 Tax=Virgisporangium aliadipatigenens TaxID=741659 RepID=A0A8J3YPA2_9ACTN|nr:choice-of-anchor M domain-containing protein [Virgisporangium aliadipatigenens]GIJ49249.1 hypothetical protein Val02_61350 [Virgisporangium aliadipatigenens]